MNDPAQDQDTKELAADFANFAGQRAEFGHGLGASVVTRVAALQPHAYGFTMKVRGKEYGVRVVHIPEHDVPEPEEEEDA